MNRWTRPTSKTNFKHLKEPLHIKQELSVESFLSSSTNTSSHHHLTCPPPTHSRSSEKGNLFNWSHAGYISKRSVQLHKRFLGLSSHHCYNQRLPGCEPRSLISKNILCWSVISLCSTLTSLLSTLKKRNMKKRVEVSTELTGLGVQDFLLRQERNHFGGQQHQRLNWLLYLLNRVWH